MMEKPTPKTLEEAVVFAMCTAAGPEPVGHFVTHIQDFLAQRFQSAMLEHQDAEGVLENLYKEIIR